MKIKKCILLVLLITSFNKNIQSISLPKTQKNLIRNFVTGFAIHYMGQTLTNIIYTLYPQIKQSPLQPFISLGQAIVSFRINHKIYQGKRIPYLLANTTAGICAHCTPKPATLIKGYYYKTLKKITTIISRIKTRKN